MVGPLLTLRVGIITARSVSKGHQPQLLSAHGAWHPGGQQMTWAADSAVAKPLPQAVLRNALDVDDGGCCLPLRELRASAFNFRFCFVFVFVTAKSQGPRRANVELTE